MYLRGLIVINLIDMTIFKICGQYWGMYRGNLRVYKGRTRGEVIGQLIKEL